MVRLGIGLPSTLYAVDRRLLLEWARTADQAGFHALGTIDKPNYDSLDPLTALAAAAGVTEHIRLATTILQLPNRNEVLVAKQAAAVDVLSQGRLDLGVALGGRSDDFDVLRARFRGRARRFGPQVKRMREVWEQARESDTRHGVLGPAPVQVPGPPVWIGATSKRGIDRAVRIGDGYIYPGAGSVPGADEVRKLRKRGSRKGPFTVAAIAYFAAGDDADTTLDAAERELVRYYGRLWAEPKDIVLYGSADDIGERVAKFAAAGIDVLVLHPLIANVLQVQRIAETVLPAYVDATGQEPHQVERTVKDSFPASDPPPY